MELQLTGIQEIVRAYEERRMEVGGTSDDDDKHIGGELVDAGVSYALEHNSIASDEPPAEWPWRDETWNPSSDPIQNLAKAGALIAAEIDRRKRAAQ